MNGYAAVRRIINDTIAQHPEATKRAREIGRQALAIIRESRNPDKSYNLDKFEAAVGARQAKQTTTAETRAAVKETDGTAKDVPTVTEAEALKARYKAER
ncbi:MAG: hypothetical protein EBR82_83870, partial [Caulobacteraceae bacterium]|nr:hypothetical protein [Caulobacteraceae bacterium]